MPTRHEGPADERLALDLFIKLSRANHSIQRRVHSSLHEFGLTPTQFGVLDALHFGGPMPISDIAEKNLSSQNSMCSVIDTMERKHLVERKRDPQDRRVVWVHLSESGEALHASVWPGHIERIVRVVSNLTPHEIGTLCDLLRKLGKSLPDNESP
ncbi:MAG: MarR family winged helix-turn-helix transcriptional regulator [Fimbriimonas sp.]